MNFKPTKNRSSTRSYGLFFVWLILTPFPQKVMYILHSSNVNSILINTMSSVSSLSLIFVLRTDCEQWSEHIMMYQWVFQCKNTRNVLNSAFITVIKKSPWLTYICKIYTTQPYQVKIVRHFFISLQLCSKQFIIYTWVSFFRFLIRFSIMSQLYNWSLKIEI